MLKHAAETLLAFDLSSHGLIVGWCNRNIANPLVRTLGVVVFGVFVDDMPKLLLAEEDHLVQAFVLDGSDEAFRVGVEVRRAGRGEKGTVRLCYDPLPLNNHEVVNDDFEHHLHLSTDLCPCSQVAAEVAFDHADGGLGLCALAVGFAGL